MSKSLKSKSLNLKQIYDLLPAGEFSAVTPATRFIRSCIVYLSVVLVIRNSSKAVSTYTYTYLV